MNKYEVYQVGKIPPLTIIEADGYEIDFKTNDVCFSKGKEPIAYFNWNNIAGIRTIEGETE